MSTRCHVPAEGTTAYRIVELSRTVLRLEALAVVPAQQADGAGLPDTVAYGTSCSAGP